MLTNVLHNPPSPNPNPNPNPSQYYNTATHSRMAFSVSSVFSVTVLMLAAILSIVFFRPSSLSPPHASSCQPNRFRSHRYMRVTRASHPLTMSSSPVLRRLRWCPAISATAIHECAVCPAPRQSVHSTASQSCHVRQGDHSSQTDTRLPSLCMRESLPGIFQE